MNGHDALKALERESVKATQRWGPGSLLTNERFTELVRSALAQSGPQADEKFVHYKCGCTAYGSGPHPTRCREHNEPIESVAAPQEAGGECSGITNYVDCYVISSKEIDRLRACEVLLARARPLVRQYATDSLYAEILNVISEDEDDAIDARAAPQEAGGEKCPACGARVINAPGLPPYCPNAKCGRLDDLRPAPQEAGGWQPIETAPKGRAILVWIPSTELPWPAYRHGPTLYSNAHGRLNEPEGFCGRVLAATHWMPLPSPPSGSKL